MSSPDQWLAKLAKLRVDRATGDPAPHKPLLLLAILELAEQNDLPNAVLPLSPELAFRFLGYWSAVSRRGRQKPDVRLPFHHLQTDGFWNAFTEDGKPSPHNRQTNYVELLPEFVACSTDPCWREKARRVIVTTYFQPIEQLALCELMGIPDLNVEDAKAELAVIQRTEAERDGRDARFRMTVIPAYNYTCALTGYRLTTVSGGSIVDAAHIHQFSNSRNNDPTNGIALCKNAHWLFDQGLWSITDDYRIIIATDRFSEDCPDKMGLVQYQGKSIRTPRDKSLWPNPIHLAWHREKKLQYT